MSSNVSCDILPSDEELQARDKLWSTLFEKYTIDEGSEAELVDDDYLCELAEKDEEEDLHTSDNEEVKCDEEENENDDFDLEKIASQLKPLVEERIAAWPQKGVTLLLKTVDPSVTVEEWIQANSECTTTTTEVEETVIDTHNKTITKSTNRTTITKQTIQIKIANPAVEYNDRQQFENIIKSIMHGSSAETKSSQSTDKNRSDANVLKQNKLKIPVENSVKQQSSVIVSSKTAVATSKKMGKKLQSTPKVMPHQNGEQSLDKIERDDTVPMQKLRTRGHRKVDAIQSEQVIENVIETSRQRNRKRKPVNIKQTQNEGRDSPTRSPLSTATINHAKMKHCYIRLSKVVLPANTGPPSACYSDDEDVLQTVFRRLAPSLEPLSRPAVCSRLSFSNSDSESEVDDILATNYAKLIENQEIF